MYKKMTALAVLITMMFSLCSCKKDASVLNAESLAKKWGITSNAENNKVILDVSYLNDDAYALLAVLQADTLGYIDLLGVTSSSGNVFASASLYDTLSVLEHIDRGDVPTYMGNDKPTNGWADIEGRMRSGALVRLL